MSVFSEESLQLRRELAYACRILAANGQNDTVYGHVTYRKAGAKTFWMKPAALGLEEITPETLIRVDLEGTVVEGELPRHLEFPIHAEIFRARPMYWLLGTSVHKIGGLSQYNGSHLPSCFYEKMHVSRNSRTGKLMLNENTCTYTSTKQRGNIFSSSVEGNAKTPSHVDTAILFRRMGFISPL